MIVSLLKVDLDGDVADLTLRVWLEGETVDHLQTLHRLAQSWCDGTVVPHQDGKAPVPDELRDDGQRNTAADKLGGERAAEGVGREAGFVQAATPADEELRDAIRREVGRLACSLLGQWPTTFAEYQSLSDSIDAICRLIAERDRARFGLAKDEKRLADRVKVLEAEARQLRSAHAGAQQKFEDIRVALRGFGDWVSMIDRVNSLFPAEITAARALNEVQRLLPPEHPRSDLGDSGQRDATERQSAAPSVLGSDAEDPRNEA